MAFRFRRSVKVGKGIRLNVSKRGVGMSVGKTGLRRSMHSTGRSTSSIGIPGTGLSYINTKTSSGRQKTRRNDVSTSLKQSTNDNVAAVEEYNDYIDAITHLHLNEPETNDWKEISKREAPFKRDTTGPLEADAKMKHSAYEPNVLERLIKPLQTKKRKQLEQEIEVAHIQDTNNFKEWEALNNLAENVLLGKSAAYEKVIENSLAFSEAKERGMSIRGLDTRSIEIEVQVSPNKVVPNKALSLTKTGKVSKRKIGKTKYYGIKKDFVCGYVLAIAKEIFASLPVDTVIIHVNEHALNTATGHHKNEVLLSVLIDRKTIDHLNFESIVPSDALDNFQHHIDHLKTKGFRPIQRISIE